MVGFRGLSALIKGFAFTSTNSTFTTYYSVLTFEQTFASNKAVIFGGNTSCLEVGNAARILDSIGMMVFVAALLLVLFQANLNELKWKNSYSSNTSQSISAV
jgi:hypothetical protein